jgi:hypothetical protein
MTGLISDFLMVPTISISRYTGQVTIQNRPNKT